jgi:hypothetical protein
MKRRKKHLIGLYTRIFARLSVTRLLALDIRCGF